MLCLNGPTGGFDLDQQIELFEVALDELEREPDFVNQVLEVTIETADAVDIAIRRYSLPAS